MLINLFVLGCCVGSFLNVVIYRLPLDKSIVYPNSSCPKLTFSWNKPNKLLPTMAEIINTKATMAKRALTSFMS